MSRGFPGGKLLHQYNKSQPSFFILDDKKWGIVGGSDHYYFFCIAVATVGVLTASNNDIKLVETRTVHFAKIKSLFRLEGISKLIVLPNRITKIPRNIAFIPL